MKRIFILLVIMLISCDIKYDGDTRLQIKGKIIGENNLPISNQDIKVFATQESTYGETNQIGVGKTDTNGNYTIYFPQAYNFDSYYIEINSASTNELTDFFYLNIKNENFINYSLSLPNTKLYLKSNLAYLNVSYNQINTNNVLQNVEFIGEVITNQIDLNASQPAFQDINFKKVTKNQTIELKYTLFNTTTQSTSVQSEFISIGNTDTVNYILNY